MKESVITVCYNSAETIVSTIRSVISQTYNDIEYIIVDGGSTDNTLQIVEKYKEHVDVLISEPDKGIYDAMNKGVNVASGDIVGILNSDDFYETENSINSIVSEFNDDVNIVFGDMVYVNAYDLKKVIRFYSLPNFAPWKLRFGWMPPHPATFIRKDIYNKYGIYKTDYKISADYEIFVRFLLLNKLSFKYVNKTIVRMRAGGVSTSGLKSSIQLNKEIVRACMENKVYTNFIFLMTKVPFKLLELFKRPKAEK